METAATGEHRLDSAPCFTDQLSAVKMAQLVRACSYAAQLERAAQNSSLQPLHAEQLQNRQMQPFFNFSL
jgi:hypothetical protein